MIHAVLRPRQASQGRLLRLLQVLAPPNSDRTRNAGPDMGSSSLGNGEAIEAQITQFSRLRRLTRKVPARLQLCEEDRAPASTVDGALGDLVPVYWEPRPDKWLWDSRVQVATGR
jgi:hypothetical protein